jgi:hypothetical protein
MGRFNGISRELCLRINLVLKLLVLLEVAVDVWEPQEDIYWGPEKSGCR